MSAAALFEKSPGGVKAAEPTPVQSAQPHTLWHHMHVGGRMVHDGCREGAELCYTNSKLADALLGTIVSWYKLDCSNLRWSLAMVLENQ